MLHSSLSKETAISRKTAGSVRLAARFSNPTHCFNDPFYAPYGESLFKPSVWILTVVVKKILNLQTFVETIDVVSLGIKKHDV